MLHRFVTLTATQYKTCRFIHELIQNDKSLQYKIELVAAGFVRNACSESHGLSAAYQLDILKVILDGGTI